MFQRDSFIEKIKCALKTDKDIYFLSADFGAPALDGLRNNFSKNFLHCGISEQTMIDTAVGLALENKKVFCYAMAPFLAIRALEQIKCGPGIMSLPICLISVGVGIGYADAGPTHYVTEDFACLRAIVGSNIYTASDGIIAGKIAEKLLSKPEFAYVRLDREDLPDLYSINDNELIKEKDYAFHYNGDLNTKNVLLVSHGIMTHKCMKIVQENTNIALVDIFKAKPFPQCEHLKKVISQVDMIVVVDEQTPSGSLGAAVFEWCSANNLFPKIFNVTIPETYIFQNGGRKKMHLDCGLTEESILKKINLS